MKNAKDARVLTDAALLAAQAVRDKTLKKDVADLLDRIKLAANCGRNYLSVGSQRETVVKAMEDLGFEYVHEMSGIGGDYYEYRW